MAKEGRNSVSRHEERLLFLQSPCAAVSRIKKRIRHYSGEDYTVRDLLQAADIDLNSLDEKIAQQLDSKCKGIYRAGSRFQGQSIVFQMYQDGPGVIRWAMKHGALFAITRENIPGVPCIVTEKPFELYGRMAAQYRNQRNISVTAITGSIGKTTTKRMIDSVYRRAFNVFVDPENENQIDCVGYICQHIPQKCRHMIQEVSEDVPGSVGIISEMIHPNIAVITSIDKSHIEQFGNEEKIAEEIASIAKGMDADGCVVFSIDEEATKNLEFPQRCVRVSMVDESADILATNIKVTAEGLSFEIRDLLSKDNRVHIALKNIYGIHNVYSALYAYSCGVLSGIPVDDIKAGIESFKMTGIRQNVIGVSNDVLVYADCYNAVAKSVRSAIAASKEIPGRNRHIAVLGDIAEAGSFTKSTHDEIIEMLAESGFEIALLYGEAITSAYHRFGEISYMNVICCSTKHEICKVLKNVIRQKDLVLFKASRSSALEECIAELWPNEYKQVERNHKFEIIKWRLKMVAN